MRIRKRFTGLLATLLLSACRSPAAEPPRTNGATLPQLFESALATEAHEPLLATGYLDAIDAGVASWNDPWAAPVVAASLDALVWRRTAELSKDIEQAVLHRSRSGFIEVTARLRSARLRAENHPILGPMLANALHELALRTGAEPEAEVFRRGAGCVENAKVVGPLAWPAIGSLDAPLGVLDAGAFPKRMLGIGPFATELTIEPSQADACAHELDATGTSTGLRALIVDVVQARAGWVYVSVGARSPIRLDLGGKTLIKRTVDITDGTAISFARAWVDAGRARLVLRIAPLENGERIALQLVDERGARVPTLAPEAGDRADAVVHHPSTLEIVPEAHTSAEAITAASADLALGYERRASHRLERPGALPDEPPAYVELLRMRAWRAADETTGVPLENLIRSHAARAVAACPKCWEARLADAQATLVRLGGDPGTYAALARLGITNPAESLRGSDHSAPELAYIALAARSASLEDLTRSAYEQLSIVAPGSALAADVDEQLHPRAGAEAVAAACQGGRSRSESGCLMTRLSLDDLDGALHELARLRRLRGNYGLFRQLELNQLLAHGQLAHAARLYDALPAAERSSPLLALLAPEEGKRRLKRDRLNLGDAPYGFEPIARILGLVADPALTLEKEGVALVAQDRVEAFLPGAGTAVLRHVERYELNEQGLLLYWTYDLRRVSDTEDVATRAESDEPRVLGKSTSRPLRRRIHKRDGRVLDPDPSASGAQGHTDLSQLEKGDYVEQIAIGWALPEDHGNIVVDGPDAMPPRTSVREARIEVHRPKSVPMKLWSHALLGEPITEEHEGQLSSTWQLKNQAPRRFEQGVPPLEAAVAVSFGTDDYARIGRALGEQFRLRDESDPFVARFAAQALAPNESSLDPEGRVARITAAVGKAVRIADPVALGDHLAATSGTRGDLAREILERGQGSRTWVVHRALREAGVESRIAVAETKPWSASPNFPAHIGRFTHPLVLVRLANKSLWIDADVEGPPLPPGRVSPELRGRMALLTDGSLVQVGGSTEEDADSIDIALQLDEHGLAKGSFRADLHGRAAQSVAGALETLVGESRTNLLRSIALGWIPWADIRNVSLSSDKGSWEIAITADIAPSSFAEPEERTQTSWALPGIQPFHSVLPNPHSSSLAARFTAQADRKSTLAVDSPLFFRVHRTVALPANWTITSTPPLLALLADRDSPFAARRSMVERGSVLDETFELNLPVHVIEPDDFEAFSARIRSVDEGFAFSTRASIGKK